jgi:hypothetical protein
MFSLKNHVGNIENMVDLNSVTLLAIASIDLRFR